MCYSMQWRRVNSVCEEGVIQRGFPPQKFEHYDVIRIYNKTSGALTPLAHLCSIFLYEV